MTTVADLYAQLDLFSMADKQQMPAHNGSITSVLAALEAIPHITDNKLRILAYLAERPDGQIQERIADDLGMALGTVNGRVNEMADDHWIEPAGVGKTKYGKSARAWVIGDRGREALSAGTEPDPACQNVADVTATRSGG